MLRKYINISIKVQKHIKNSTKMENRFDFELQMSYTTLVHLYFNTTHMNDINNYKAESLVCQIRKMDHLIKGINTSLRNELTNEMPIGRKSHFDEDIDSAPMFHKSKKQTRLENIEKEMLLKRKNLVKDLLTFRRQK